MQRFFLMHEFMTLNQRLPSGTVWSALSTASLDSTFNASKPACAGTTLILGSPVFEELTSAHPYVSKAIRTH